MTRFAEDLLQELQSLDESHRIEAKRATKIDRSIMESVCAFANEPGLGGGYLLLGVARDPHDLFGNAYVVEGVDEPDQLQADFASQCASVFNRPIRPHLTVEKVDGRTVIVAHVHEAAPTEKPIYIRSLGLPRGAFRRVGPTDQEGTDDDLMALYSGHQVDTYDSAIVADSDWSDIDLAAIGDYRQLRRDAHTDAEELGWSDEELLRALGCVKREDGHLKPTVAGILFFGTNKALRRCFPMMRIDYIRVPGRHWVENPDHRFNTLEIRAPLFSAIRKATSAIHDELIQSFTLAEGSLAREDEPALPLRVIREAVVNAVMHRSYRIHGTVQIIRYANRLEIRNPGHSIKAEEQLGEPGSETRNPRIAAVLHEVNIAETKGSGIRAMRELMIAQGLLPPTFESSRRPDQFVGTFLFHHFLGPDDLAWLGRLTAEPLSDEEARALVFVREVGAIDNAAYRAINRTDTLNASVHLRHLRDLDLLAMKGAGNRAYYVPGKHFQPNLAANAQDSHQPGPDSHQPIPDSHHPLATISEDLRRRIPPAGSKPRRAVLRELIIDLCRWRPLSARELATILNGREPKPLVRDYLTPLVAEGLLVYTIPEMENHPEQRYVAGPTTEVSPDE